MITKNFKPLNFHQHALDASTFLSLLAKDLGYSNERAHADILLQSFFNALKDHISIKESFLFIEKLPLFLKAVYIDGWKYEKNFDRSCDLKEFLQKVKENQKKAYDDCSFNKFEVNENDTKIIISKLREYFSSDELSIVISHFPERLRPLLTI